MIRPALWNAFEAIWCRRLCLDEDGSAVFDEDGPDSWALSDSIEPQLCRVGELRVSLISTSIDEKLTRAFFEVDSFDPAGPVGVTQPRMGDLIAVEVGSGVYQNFEVQLTYGEVLAGVDADLAPHELHLALKGLWMEAEHE